MRKAVVTISVIGLILIIIVLNIYFDKNDVNKKNDDSTKITTTRGSERGESTADFEDSRYVDEKVEDDEDGTFVAPVEDDDGYEHITDAEKVLYKISDVKFKEKDKYTVITGKVKNINNETKDIIIVAEFYDEKKKVVAASSVSLKKLAKNKEKKFTISIMNNVMTDDYKVYVKYVRK